MVWCVAFEMSIERAECACVLLRAFFNGPIGDICGGHRRFVEKGKQPIVSEGVPVALCEQTPREGTEGSSSGDGRHQDHMYLEVYSAEFLVL